MRLGSHVCKVLIAFIASVLFGPSVAAQSLDLAVSKGPVSLLIYVAQANGYFDREGVKITTHDCSSGRDCFRMMTDGVVQVATAAELVATLNSFSHPDLAFIASISASSHQIKLVGRKSAGISDPSSITGKRIGTVVGSSAQYFLGSWLVYHSIDPSSITLVPMVPERVLPAFERGEIDAVSIWEPTATAALQALGGDGVLLPNPRVYTQHFGLITTRSAIAANELALLKLLRALVRAERFIAGDAAKAKDILMARLEVSSTVAQAQLQEHDFRIRLDQSLVNTMSSQMRWAVREGHLHAPEGARPSAPAAEPALLRKVAPGAVTVVQ